MQVNKTSDDTEVTKTLSDHRSLCRLHVLFRPLGVTTPNNGSLNFKHNNCCKQRNIPSHSLLTATKGPNTSTYIPYRHTFSPTLAANTESPIPLYPVLRTNPLIADSRIWITTLKEVHTYLYSTTSTLAPTC